MGAGRLAVWRLLEGADLIRTSVLALTLVTGFAGLVYEVVWQRYVAILLGSDSESTAAVLGIFLGGLALGYRVFGT